MSDLSKAKAQILVVQFLVPIYDRKGKPYPRSVQKGVRRDLEDRFDGWSLAADKPLTGAWRNPESGQVEYDDSWRYEIGIAPSRLADLDAYLAQLAPSTRPESTVAGRVCRRGGEGDPCQGTRQAVSVLEGFGCQVRSKCYS
jgi:hypothetical protein